jgi:hypothetical protein
MAIESRVGELRAWNRSTGLKGTFVVIEVDGYRVDVIVDHGKREGFLKLYLEFNSHVISEETYSPSGMI